MFEACFELKPAFDVLLSKPDQLTLVTDELYGETQRAVAGKLEDGRAAVMEGVEHLGKYVFEMTKAKVESLKQGAGSLPVAMNGNGNGVAEVHAVDEEDEDRPEKVLVKEEDMDLDMVPEEPEEVQA